MNIFQRFLSIVKDQEARIAITNERYQATYRQLLQQIECLRPLFSKNRKEGQHIVILLALPGGPHFTAIQLAGFSEGAIVVPVPQRSTTHETRGYLRFIQPDVVVVESFKTARAILEALEEPTAILSLDDADKKNDLRPARFSKPRRSDAHRMLSWEEIMNASPGTIQPLDPGNAKLPPDTALLQFTSGSTGSPSGILLSNANIIACLDNSQSFLSQFSGKSVFCPMPQFHAFGCAVVLEHLLSGSPVHLANRFLPGEDLKRMQTNECAAILAAPAYFRLLLQFDMLKPELLPSLTSVTLGTAPVDQSLVKKIRERFPQINIYLRYGLTETIGTLTRLTLGPGEILSHPGLVGTPIPGAELAPELPLPDQGEPGEIRVKSGIVAVGELLEKDQWRTLTDNRGLFSTGDLGYMDEKGQLHLRGRISSFIKRNGFRINPFEIESLLREMPGIQEAMVVGVPDPLSGQQVIAYVEPMPGKPDPDPKDLMNICAANLSAYKLPQRIVVTDAIPKTRSGKIVRTGD